jgi:hypothetical protein
MQKSEGLKAKILGGIGGIGGWALLSAIQLALVMAINSEMVMNR